MIYLKAALTGLLYSVLSLGVLVALFVGPPLWSAYSASEPVSIGAESFGFRELRFLVLPLIPLMLGFGWLYNRTQGSARRNALIVGIGALAVALCVGLAVVSFLRAMTDPAMVVTASFGLRQLLMQLVPPATFVGGFLFVLTRRDEPPPSGNALLHGRAAATGLVLALAITLATPSLKAAAASEIPTWADALAQRLSLPDTDAGSALAMGLSERLDSLFHLLPLLLFALGFVGVVRRAHRATKEIPDAQPVAASSLRYSTAALSGLMWAAGFLVLFAPVALWRFYVALESAGTAVFSAQALTQRAMFVEVAGVWLPLFAFGFGAWWSLRRSGGESSTHSQ